MRLIRQCGATARLVVRLRLIRMPRGTDANQLGTASTSINCDWRQRQLHLWRRLLWRRLMWRLLLLLRTRRASGSVKKRIDKWRAVVPLGAMLSLLVLLLLLLRDQRSGRRRRLDALHRRNRCGRNTVGTGFDPMIERFQ